MKKLKLYKLILVGQLAITFPIILLMIGLPLLVFFLFDNLALKIILMIVSFIVGTIAAWILWSMLITKWRIWAFSQLDNETDMIQLKDLAVKTALIWEDGHEFELTEIGTIEEHLMVDQISNIIHDAEQFEGIKAYVETPSSVGYKINKISIFYYLGLEIFTLSLSIMGFVLMDNYLIPAFILLIFCAVFWEGKTYQVIKHLFSNKYFLELDDKFLHIRTPKKYLIAWENIESISFTTDNQGMFIYTMDNDLDKPLKINLWTYQIPDYKQFKKTVQVFVDRSKIKN